MSKYIYEVHFTSGNSLVITEPDYENINKVLDASLVYPHASKSIPINCGSVVLSQITHLTFKEDKQWPKPV